MEYLINQLALISGVSTRTLRYYDSIGLLKPLRIDENGYRIYGVNEVDLLQEMLFYRELGMPLEEIRSIVNGESFDRSASLKMHLTRLEEKKKRIESLIENVKKTICNLKGEIKMTDQEKFEGFKDKLIRENTEKYGEEVIAKYGKEAFDASNMKLSGMDESQWKLQEQLKESIFIYLKKALKKSDPTCNEAQEAARIQKEWLCMFWDEKNYSKEVHLNLAKMYLTEPRFTSYYDDGAGDGAAQMLYDALKIFLFA
ncbi:MerR family transcriptional regulator [Microaceticoccus formicicus]|uniref:MerR family transcriptional regulator n=1 Tax=Microaceticoccus formicicus TaxID=3118105 RepID=UPI003CD02F52|nr:MerR family transcriptional regulator [Peptoniphilaceae bacterium AMB_02]